ncbi:MAG: GGDEF and EAL domain-containing protein [Arcobacteraceae bacterium]|jgi:diguanylate cyclase (GGDEF)-like protein|nr:GGDEF and EAL domain-containing protein [Arcobacteraceae bacterium]
MNFMTVKNKLFLLVVVSTVLLSIVSFQTILNGNLFKETINRIILLGQINQTYHNLSSSIKSYQFYLDDNFFENYENDYNTLNLQIESLSNILLFQDNKNSLEELNHKLEKWDSLNKDKIKILKSNQTKISEKSFFYSNEADKLSSLTTAIANISYDINNEFKILEHKIISDNKKTNQINRVFTIILIVLISILLMSMLLVISRDIQKKLLIIQDGLFSFFSFLGQETNNFKKINLNSKDEFGIMAKTINENIKKIKKIILYDELTSLKNRKKLFIDLPNFPDPKIALFDIDNFSNINDFYGNEMGDFLLKEVANILSTHIYKTSSVYRFTNDKFIILSTLHKDEFIKMINDLINTIKKYDFEHKNFKIRISLSVAISFEHPKILLNSVEAALKELKKHRLSYLVYDSSLRIEENIKNNIYWTTKIKNAIEESRFTVHYQAIYNNQTQKVEKYESLIRMIAKDGSIITPYYFLDFAKQSKQYIELTKIVLEKSFAMFENNDFEFSINLTIEDILSEEIRKLINQKLQNSSFHGRVVFEIVESEGIENTELITNFIQTLKQYGCKIAIDDFGTGYSNFVYLLKLAPDYIKIDGSMIKNIDSNQEHYQIVKTIVDFAKVKNIKIIAEFVCNVDVFNKVKELGIDYSQGYYIAMPNKSL